MMTCCQPPLTEAELAARAERHEALLAEIKARMPRHCGSCGSDVTPLFWHGVDVWRCDDDSCGRQRAGGLTMTTKAPSSESADLCAIVLVLCQEWLRLNHPEARMRAEVEPGDWREINLLSACEGALAEFRREHGDGGS